GTMDGGPVVAGFVGSITAAPDAPGIDLERWKLLIAMHPNLAPVPSREGVNPFTKGTHTYRAHPGNAHVVVAGSKIGTMSWAQDGTNRIAVEGDARLVEPIAIEVASELGGVYRR